MCENNSNKSSKAVQTTAIIGFSLFSAGGFQNTKQKKQHGANKKQVSANVLTNNTKKVKTKKQVGANVLTNNSNALADYSGWVSELKVRTPSNQATIVTCQTGAC